MPPLVLRNQQLRFDPHRLVPVFFMLLLALSTTTRHLRCVNSFTLQHQRTVSFVSRHYGTSNSFATLPIRTTRNINPRSCSASPEIAFEQSMNTNPIGDTKTTATSNSTNTLDRPSTTNNTSSSTSHHANHNNNNNTHIVPLHRVEGIFAVYKPIDWTSNDVVSYLRGILERDARERGAKHAKVGSRGRSNKLETVKVGHGGTLDPLATGVLVIGVGSGTKQMSSLLSGSKRYSTTAELGYETTTLDAAGTIVKQMPWDHVTMDSIQAVLPSFRGTIQQVPPAFSAIRKGGKRMYEEARQGKTQADLQIQARPVEVYHLELIQPLPQQQQHDNDEAVVALPKFQLQVECGGGTYIRSLVRDIGIQLGTVATTIQLERTQQAQFTLDDALKKDDWTADNIYHAIEKCNDRFGDSSNNNK